MQRKASLMHCYTRPWRSQGMVLLCSIAVCSSTRLDFKEDACAQTAAKHALLIWRRKGSRERTPVQHISCRGLDFILPCGSS